MIIGAGLVAATGGAAAPGLFGLSNAATIGLGLGGLETLRTGSLRKGLMAGLGAYGGAGLAGGLMGAGAAGAGPVQLGGPGMEEAANAAAQQSFGQNLSQMGRGITSLGSETGREGFMNAIGGGKELLKYGTAAAAPVITAPSEQGAKYTGSGANPYQYTYNAGVQDYAGAAPTPYEQQYFRPAYTRMAEGGPVEQMSMMNQPSIQSIDNGGNVAGYAGGGISHLGDYSDGGRLLKGPGDGVSDSIPATIANKQPARLADGEFVVPARIVSELGNGSTDAGARKLYAMMDRIQKARGKTTGKDRVAVNSRAEKLLPA
jgi:hypothetical protein